MNEKTCCFTGHRRIPPETYSLLFKRTEEIVEALIKKGYLYFGAGGAMGFDTLAAFVVLKLKKRYPAVRLILVLPCLSQTRGWSREDIERYKIIKDQADKVVYTSKEYTAGCMHKRNRHLVDNSSVCICYFVHHTGGTFYTVNYAFRQNKRIINVADQL